MNQDPGSITQWVKLLQAGERDAARQIWDRLYPKLLKTATRHFRKNSDPATSAEDIVQSSFRNVFQGVMNPEALVDLSDFVEYLFRRLDQEDPSGELRQIASIHLDGHSSAWIAKTLRQRKYKVHQKIHWIRILWEECVF